MSDPADDHSDRDSGVYGVNGLPSEEEWVPEDVLAAVAMEKSVHPDESAEAQSRRLFKENATAAAASILHIALRGSNERLRLDASKYVVERVLGRVGEDKGVDEEQPLDAMLRNMALAAEVHANKDT